MLISFGLYGCGGGDSAGPSGSYTPVSLTFGSSSKVAMLDDKGLFPAEMRQLSMLSQHEKSLMEKGGGFVASLFISDVIAALPPAMVSSVTVAISGPGMTTMNDIVPVKLGTVVTKQYNVPVGLNRKFSIGVYDVAGVLVAQGRSSIANLSGGLPIAVDISVIPTETVPPVITMLGASPITIAASSPYVDAGATALDNWDGNIAAKIVATSTVNTAVIGAYTVTYNVSDAAGNAATSVVRTVNVLNTPPTLINNIALAIAENSAATVLTTAMLQATDAEHTAVQLSYTLTAAPTAGQLRFNGVALSANSTFTQADINAGLISYLPSLNLNGADGFSFNVSDPLGASLTTGGGVLPAFAITITPVNSAPTSTSATINTNEDTVSLALTPNVIDPDIGDTHTFAIVTQGVLGTATVVANQLVYTPNLNANGTDTFTFRATDAAGLAVIGSATVNIAPVNDAPIPTAPAITTVIGTASTSQVSHGDVDIGDTHTYAIATAAANGTATISVTGLLSYAPNALFVGADTVTVSVTDAGGLTASVTINIAVGTGVTIISGATANISGVNCNTNWTAGVYDVRGTVTVANGCVLNIAAGAIVKNTVNATLTVSSGGTLNVNGTPAKPVIFTSIKDDTVGGDTNGDGAATAPALGDWWGITYNTGSLGSISFAEVDYASTALNISASISLNDVGAYSTNGIAVSGLGVAPTMTRVSIIGDSAAGIFAGLTVGAGASGSYNIIDADYAILNGVPTQFDNVTLWNFTATQIPLKINFSNTVITFNNLLFNGQALTTGSHIGGTGLGNTITVQGINKPSGLPAVLAAGWTAQLTLIVVPEVFVLPTSLLEGSGGGATTFNITISLSQTSAQNITLDYATADLTGTGVAAALAASDYTATAATVTIPAGQLSAVVPILVNADRLYEGNEEIGLTVSKNIVSVGNVIAPSGITWLAATILNDDVGGLNDTGITTWGNAAVNNLVVTQALFPNQDADRGRDAAVTLLKTGGGNAGFDFTKLDSAGQPLINQATTYATTPWSCVQDNLTGLMWEVKTPAAAGGLRDANHTYSWFNSTTINDGGAAGTANTGICVDALNCDTEKYVAAVNAAGLCGFTDWRLPEDGALYSIVDHSAASMGKTIDAVYFPNTLGGPYWSSSPYAGLATSAWSVDYNLGGNGANNKTTVNAVRLVRGGL